ncbi:MAG: hypothetical protein ABIP38_01940 [Steroidobacteraceae bacterium]
MNLHTSRLAWAFAAALAIPAYVGAAERSHRCAEQIDDAQRLACYDAEYGKPGNGAANGAAATRTQVVQPPDARPVENRSRTRKSVPDLSTASVTALSTFPDGRFRATLDNGNIWTQLEPDRAAVLAVGDKVNIKKALLGSFLMTTPAGVVTRVKQMP